MLSCQWKEMGMECLGCGFQRSVVLVLKGDFQHAFLLYPAIYTLFLMMIFLGLHLRFNFSKGHSILKWLFILNIVIIVVNYILKLI
ncbi:DUF2752 domain-containing protein [Lutimonas vermicola]|uniref:DUF2752 domain-containing protein n=1 Tax=Lutimonas vermicola TaxID=414288 RepID=A0ABU9L1S6_9FLAO